MKKTILTLATVLTALLPTSAQQSITERFAQRLTLPPYYICQRTTQQMTIDGQLDEEVWGKAAETAPFADISGEGFHTPKFTTRARMLWDDDCLYIAAVLEEPNIVAKLTQRDTIIYHDNDFEVFLDPDGDGQDYFEIENNARGVVFDLMLDRPYRSSGNFLIQWDCPGLQLAVSHDGTLNNPADKDRSWTVEMAIPHKAVTVNFDNPLKAGKVWRMNFSRVQWLKKGGPEENWVWAPTGKIDIHNPDRWGFVLLSDKKAGTKTETFQYPYQMDAYRLLWAMFYAQMEHRSKSGAFIRSTNGFQLTSKELGSLPSGSKINMEATDHAFRISISVPQEKVTYVVDEKGRFTCEPLKQ